MKRHLTDCIFVSLLIVPISLGCKLGDTEQQGRENVSGPAAVNSTAPAVPANAASAVNSTPTPPTVKANAVCADPAKPCHHKEKHIDDWELSFRLPAKLQPNKTYSSVAYYAVMLEVYDSAEDCDGGEYREEIEAERKELQKDNFGRKVFAEYGCPNMAAVGYDFEGKWDAKKERTLIGDFLAIYAGDTKEEAGQLLEKLKPRYPKASIKRMTANYEWIVQ